MDTAQLQVSTLLSPWAAEGEKSVRGRRQLPGKAGIISRAQSRTDSAMPPHTWICGKVPSKASILAPAQLLLLLHSAGSRAGRIRLKLAGEGKMTAKCCYSGGRLYRLAASGKSITAGGYPICHNMQCIISSHARKNVVLNSHEKRQF